MLVCKQNSHYKATSNTKLTSRTWGPAKSSRTGIRSNSSLSCASENQLLIGTACCGWKMYEVGELSMMMVSRRSRPTWDRSCEGISSEYGYSAESFVYLDIVALVIVATFSK
jgi:hypothetical protein